MGKFFISDSLNPTIRSAVGNSFGLTRKEKYDSVKNLNFLI